MGRIHYCTAVYNRWDTFNVLLDSFRHLSAQPGNETDRLQVYDWDGGGIDIYPAVSGNVYFHAGHERGHINRAHARNQAMRLAQPFNDDLVFFLDCDMVLPPDFSDRVRTHVKTGQAYFPICYSLYEGAPMEVTTDGQPYRRATGSTANGWWRESGRGNCGFVAEDFYEMGGWNGERWGTRYGREDDDVYWRAVQAMQVTRERVPGFFHQWHPKPPEAQNPSTKRKP
jgi:hypothetical protein